MSSSSSSSDVGEILVPEDLVSLPESRTVQLVGAAVTESSPGFANFVLLSFIPWVCLMCLHKGFRWYTRRLRIDEDGDVADEFLDEVVPESLINNDASLAGRFQVKYNTRPTALAMRKQTIAVDGDIRHSLEHQGQLRWV